jgi:putative oxidoreductase
MYPLSHARHAVESAANGATTWMAQHSVTLLRLSLGFVFLGFGVLKFFPGLSPAAGLAGETFSELTMGIVPEALGVYVVAAMETVIGLSLLSGRLLRLGLTLLGFAMVGILSPLVLVPEELFRGALYAPTLAGQYVLKDVVLLAAGLAVAVSVLGRRPLGPSAR